MEFSPSPDDMRIMAEAIGRALSERNTRHSLDDELLAAAAQAIRREDRRRLLRDIPAEVALGIVAYLVGDDPELEGIARERGWSEADLERDAC